MALPSFVKGAEVTVAAHSLGNMVVSQAIAYGGFDPARYYMINGAVSIEAYDPTQATGSDTTVMADRMVEDDWKPYKAVRPALLASYWHTLFDPAIDARGKLTWQGLFSTQLPLAQQDKIMANTYNFYTRGDDVVENPEASEQLGVNVVLSLKNAWDPDVTIDQALARHAWVNQEIVKGGQNIGAEALIEVVHGGWEFNFEFGVYFPGVSPLDGYYKWDYIPRVSRKFHPAEAADFTQISSADLKTKPFHDPFLYVGLYGPSTGSTIAELPEARYNLLATAIPATSYAVAPNAIDDLINHPQGTRNYNMESSLKNTDQYGAIFWVENDAAYNGDWIHSDFRDVACTYVWPMYEKMINLGKLDVYE